MAYRPKDTQERILHRFKIAQGHLNKVLKMLEEDEYCIDIIHQSQAVQNALSEADLLILENHLKTCVVDQIRQGKTKASIEEIMKVMRKNGS
ncbi:metal-sensitive transcriptional regulator [Candidatus Daviesbacteria bacterium]|nr:metal-sensitive transcriptional regulator [Candidatus Daviesbacteria bacterium]